MATKTLVIVDETAVSSLRLLENLPAVGATARLAEGVYTVDAAEKTVLVVTDKFPEAIIKVEEIL